jgi:PAS domain S-box-containing protein
MAKRLTPHIWSCGTDHFSLIGAGATLVACLLVFLVMVANTSKADQRRLHADGKRLLRLLQTIPADNVALVDLLATYRTTLPADLEKDSAVAYLVLRDPSGRVAAQMAKPGITVPPAAPDPDSRSPARTLDGQQDMPRILELSGPILINGDPAGSINLGLFEPRFGSLGHDRDATFALLVPVVLLGLFLVLFFRHQTSAVGRLCRDLRDCRLADLGQLKLHPGSSALANSLAEGIDSFLGRCRDSIREMEKDRTALMTADKVLGYRKARLEAILEQITDGIMVLDHASMVTFANSAVETLLGRDRETIAVRKFHEWGDEPVTRFLARYQGFDGRLFRTASMEYHPSHAPDKTVSLSAYPLTRQNKDAPPLGTLVVCRDITAHVLAKQAGGDFVAHVSHELKSPLNVIRMYSEMLLGEDGRDEALRIEAINTIHDEVDRLGALITRLLKISKIELGSVTPDRQRVKLPELLRDAFASVSRNGKQSNIDFTLNSPEHISPVFVDKELLRVALNNLLTNAIKYNRPGGRVTMTAFETAGTINIQVEDTGIGIPPEEQANIFEKFYRGNNATTGDRPGHGLGLTLAKDIIDLHHGKLLVKSTPGQGTVFTVVFTKDEGLIREGI